MVSRLAALLVCVPLGCHPEGGGEAEGETELVPDPATGESGGSEGGEQTPLAIEPQPAVLPRLTQTQYRNAVRDLLGEGLPASTLQPDTNPHLFFTIGAASTTLSELGTQQYEESAEAITTAVWSDTARRDALVGCDPAGAECVGSFVATFGRRAFRRPLTAAESERWRSVATELADPDGWEGLRLVVSGMLQSPWFLYRVERGEADPEDPSRLRLTGYEMAARLAFLLWSSSPDDALLDAADAGELSDADGIRAHADRMLDDPRARLAVQDFFAEYLELTRLDTVARDPDLYPLWDTATPDDMRAEVTLLVDDVVHRRDEDVRTIFTTRRTFLNTRLASLYGVVAPGASANVFVPVELPEDGARAGLLTLGAFLTIGAHDVSTSPTLRGKYVMERVLCEDVPPPPPDADMQVEGPEDEPKTKRELLEQHRDDPACASCHALMDPPGLLFEHFDSIGAYRTHEAGMPVDASSTIDGVEYASAVDFVQELGGDERVGRCIVKQLFRHAQARLDADEEDAVLDELAGRFADADHRFRALLLELVTHDGFRHLGKGD